MDYQALKECLTNLIRDYLLHTSFGMFRFSGNRGRQRALLLEQTLTYLEQVDLLILLYALTHMQSTRLKGLVADRVSKAGMLGTEVGEKMQQYRSTKSLGEGCILSVRDVARAKLSAMSRPTDVECYDVILKILDEPFGKTLYDLKTAVKQLSSTSIRY